MKKKKTEPLFCASRLPPGRRNVDTGLNVAPWRLGGSGFYLFIAAA
jgi:hypothetical protein